MSWTAPKPIEQHVLFVKQMSSVLAANGGPLSQELDALIQDGRFRDVVEFTLDYERGHGYTDYCYARQIMALVEKQEFLDLGYDKKGTAIKAFIAAEEKCRVTNERLSLPCPTRDVSAVLHYATRKISEVLGDCPELDELDFFFGPGATTNVKGGDANARRKLSTRMACSEELLPTVGQLLAELPLWTNNVGTPIEYEESRDSSGVVTGYSWSVVSVPVDVSVGKLHFVPKNSKTFRPICIEPVLNSLLQKGYGSVMKRRLRKFGVDLFDQSRNQELAGIGSREGNLATIDLKSASDTVSIGLVFSLLPFEWATRLSECRTGRVECEGVLLDLEKFSSMGNGYTFELESLLFFGLMSGVVSYMKQVGELGYGFDTVIGVYGDDLIVPANCYDLAVKVLAYCGFDVNPQKSFCSGPFRESCGADFFVGRDLRPFYLRKELSEQVLYSFHNWAMRRGELEIARLCLRWTNRKLRLWGPDKFGDGHLVGSWVLLRPRNERRRGWEFGYFRTYALLPKRDLQPLPGDILMPAYSTYSGMSKEGPCDPSVTRGSFGYTRRKVYTNATGVFL
jgi:hypothetical protein